MAKKIQKIAYQIVYGINPVIELLKAKRRKLIALYVTKPVPKAWKKIEQLLPKYPLSIAHVSRLDLTRLAGSPDHQGVVAHAQPFVYRSKPFEPKKHPRLLMLDGIQDVRNLGAILRSAYCTGVDGVILGKKSCAPLNTAALKASAGYAEHLEIYLAPSCLSAAQQLANDGYTLYLATFGGKDARDVSYQKPLCLVIGAEGLGLSPQLIKFGTAVTLPQHSVELSYNASVAAGILLFLVSYLDK